MSPRPSDDPVLSGATAVERPAEAALGYGAVAVNQGAVALGAGGGTKPQYKDTRASELVRNSKRELAKELVPDYMVLLSSSIPASDREDAQLSIQTYKDRKDELQSYIDAYTGGLLTSKGQYDNWSQALWETGDMRRILANNVMCYFQGVLKTKQDKIVELNQTVSDLKARLGRVKKAMVDAKAAQATIATLLIVYDGLEAVEGIGHAITNAGAKLAVSVKLGTAISKSTVIKAGVAKLAEYSILLALVTEGFTSVDEMKAQISATVDEICAEMTIMADYEKRLATAERIYAVSATVLSLN